MKMKDVVIHRLNERAKELNCLYQVIELLKDYQHSLSYVFSQIIKIIPPAWQYSTVCCVRIQYEGDTYKSEEFQETFWGQSADIIVDDEMCGKIEVFYTQYIRDHGGSQFLPEEQKLLNTIALKLSEYLFARKLLNSVKLMKKQSHLLPHEISGKEILSASHDQHWKWRYRMAEILVSKMDRDKCGAVACYLIGSTKNATAGPKSDIDLIIHFRGDEMQLNFLKAYIRGWSYALAEVNYEKTGFKVNEGLIDLHIVTDDDIRAKTSYAVMIGSADNSAKLIPFEEE